MFSRNRQYEAEFEQLWRKIHSLESELAGYKTSYNHNMTTLFTDMARDRYVIELAHQTALIHLVHFVLMHLNTLSPLMTDIA
jgi:hypothetical protein